MTHYKSSAKFGLPFSKHFPRARCQVDTSRQILTLLLLVFWGQSVIVRNWLEYVPSSLLPSLLLSAHVSSMFHHICITAPCSDGSNTSQWRSERSPTQPMTASLIAPLSLVYRALMGPRALQSRGQTNRDSPCSSLIIPRQSVCVCGAPGVTPHFAISRSLRVRPSVFYVSARMFFRG